LFIVLLLLISLNNIITDEGKYYGMRCFYITEDSTVEEDDYEEG